MFWKLAADFISLAHGLWVAAVLLGPLFAWKRPAWRVVHLAFLFATAGAWSFYCPLTVLENSLLCRFDPSAAYGSGFLEHCLRPLIDLRRYGVVLAWGVRVWALLWLGVYAALWARERRANRPAG
jgi:hypothetical protein